jgi:hypothetical protein
VRGFDTINTAIDTDRAGYPTQTFHVAPATEATHAPQKAQLDEHINTVSAVHGATSGNSPGSLMVRDVNGDVGARTFVGDLLGTASASKTVSDTAPDSGSATLVYGTMAGSDAFRILITGTDDGGWAEIATSDNGTEPIFVRQYAGAFTNAVRTLTLLDENGDSLFPGAVKAASGGVEVSSNHTGLYGGNMDGAGFYGNNLKLSSWFGVGFAPTITGTPVPYGEYSHWFNTRNGDAGMRGTLTQNSDLRLKENILSIPDALTKVCSLRGITYDRKDGGGRSTGVIAQEVQAVLPEAVAMADDDQGTLSVAYGNLVGLLIESIKELKAEVDQLKVAISAP